MNAKDTVVGTAKKLVAEIVGDGKLAEEGARQAGGNPSMAAPAAPTFSSPRHPSPPSGDPSSQASLTDEERFATLLGHAALNVWSDLPRDAQERLFIAAVDDAFIANALPARPSPENRAPTKADADRVSQRPRSHRCR